MGLRPGHSAVGSASALGAEGREFESRCPDQFFFLHSCRFSVSGSVLPHQNWRDDSGGFPVQGGAEVFIVAAKGRDETPEVCGMIHLPCMAEFMDHYITRIFRRKEKQQCIQ